MLSSQMLRPERRDVDDRRGYEEVVPDDRVEEEDQVQNDDVEEVVDEVLEVDVPQLSRTMSKRKTKLAKSMSMLEVVARGNRLVDEDLVEEEDVKEVGRKMVMCRCGVVLSLYMGRGAGMVALLPC